MSETTLFETSDITNVDEMEISTSTWLETLGNVNVTESPNTTASNTNFTWIIQTITPPPTIIISSDYGYYYLYSFYCCLSLLFLISMILLAVRLSSMQHGANKPTARPRTCDATVTYNRSTVNVNNANTIDVTSGATGFNNQIPDDLPPKYDELINSSVVDMNMANLNRV